jgi:hypothetical protein
MPSRLTYYVWGISVALALSLFVTGITLPLSLRILGDARGYLVIADSFNSFFEAFSYAGDRTAGFPLFVYAVRRILGIFTSAEYVRAWANAIGVVLLITHVTAAWLFALWARRTNLVRSETAFLLLFAFIATYPALVGHTTSVLSDTLAVDLVLCALAAFERALANVNTAKVMALSGLSAVLFAFAILVRPGSLAGVAAALATSVAIALWAGHRNKLAVATAAVGCMLVLAPFAANCTQKYGNVCLQSPKTFRSVVSAQAGLRGARLLWQQQSLLPGQLPVMADDFMLENYFQRCRLSSIAGIDESSLTGCLLSRPLALPAFAVKKWIGLYDHFRFTPYLESATPVWLRWWSRAYDSLAWIGLWLCFAALFQVARQRDKPPMRERLSQNLTPVFLIVFSVVVLAQHTALHVEDRYGFPLIPLCAVLLFKYAEQVVEKGRSQGWRSNLPLVQYCMLAWSIFIAQIIVWDNTPFH